MVIRRKIGKLKINISSTFWISFISFFLLGDIRFYDALGLELIRDIAIVSISFGFGFFFIIKKRKISYNCGILLLAELIVGFWTIYNNRFDGFYLRMWVSAIVLSICVDIGIRNSVCDLINGISLALRILMYMDMLYLIFADYSSHLDTLAGHKNYHAILFIIFAGFEMMKRTREKKSPYSCFLFISYLVFFYAMARYNSASMIVGILMLNILVMLFYTFSKLIKIRYVLFAYLIVLIILFFFIEIDILKYILIMLDRDITFTGRTLMWSEAIKKIISNPIIGRGYLANITVYDSFLGTYFNNCHNYVLNIILSGGIGYFIVYAFLYMCIDKEVEEIIENEKNKSCRAFVGIYCSLLITMLIMGVSETLIGSNGLILSIIILGTNLHYLKV